MAEAAEPFILHRDDDWLVVAKPPGLPTTAPSANDRCLVQWVKRQLRPGAHAHATSRLDSPVSGVVTFALTRRANEHVLEVRRAALYRRLYYGITTHAASADPQRWSWPISIEPRNPRLRTVEAGAGTREATTFCECVSVAEGGTLLHIRPETGRTHQIRVHAARAGVPLFGDHAYGGERRSVSSDGTVVTARRVMLHCAQVSLPTLDQRGENTFVAPVPDDMRKAWAALGGEPLPAFGLGSA